MIFFSKVSVSNWNLLLGACEIKTKKNVGHKTKILDKNKEKKDN